MSHQLTINNISCVRDRKLLFANLSIHLKNGDVLLVEGDNGSGKSSLLKLLCGLSHSEHGDILWNAQSIRNSATAFSEQLHYVGHTNGIKLGLTVLENLKLMQKLYGDNNASLDPVLFLLNLTSEKNVLAKNLSAGQKRRLALAKLFLFTRALWILDEPFTALDVSLQTLLTKKIEEHVALGGIAIVSSHHAIPFEKVRAQIVRLPC